MSLPLEARVHAAHVEFVPRSRSDLYVSFKHIYRHLLPFLLLKEALCAHCSKCRTAITIHWLSDRDRGRLVVEGAA
jgi:hypothetical protein